MTCRSVNPVRKHRDLAGCSEWSLNGPGIPLDLSVFAEHAEELRALIEQGFQIPWVELDPSLSSDPDIALKVQARDERWHVLVRRIPERDACSVGHGANGKHG